jgi:hypothetical protein
LRDGQEVTEQELAALYRSQRSGALKCRDGELREVFVVDQRTGRRQLHFFGDPAAVWDGFTGRHRRVVGFDTKGGKVV